MYKAIGMHACKSDIIRMRACGECRPDDHYLGSMDEGYQTLTLIVPSLSQVEHLKPTSTPSTVIQGIPW